MLEKDPYQIIHLLDLDTNWDRNIVHDVHCSFILRNLHAHVVKHDFVQNPRTKNKKYHKFYEQKRKSIFRICIGLNHFWEKFSNNCFDE